MPPTKFGFPARHLHHYSQFPAGCVLPSMNQLFDHFAHGASRVLGSPYSFFASVVLLAVWAGLGPAMGFSDYWQLIVNTATTIITFLSVFLIQNTQNRDARAIQLKLDEVLRATRGARNEMIDIENLSDEQLDRLERQYRQIYQAAKRRGERAMHRG